MSGGRGRAGACTVADRVSHTDGGVILAGSDAMDACAGNILGRHVELFFSKCLRLAEWTVTKTTRICGGTATKTTRICGGTVTKTTRICGGVARWKTVKSVKSSCALTISVNRLDLEDVKALVRHELLNGCGRLGVGCDRLGGTRRGGGDWPCIDDMQSFASQGGKTTPETGA